MDAIEFRDQALEWTRLAADAMTEVFAPLAQSHGLTLLQAHALAKLREERHATVGSLVKLGMTSGNASAMCQKLERMGYLRRVRGEADGRYVRLEMTERAQAALRDIDGALERRLSPLLERRAPQEVEEALEGLRHFCQLMLALQETPMD